MAEDQDDKEREKERDVVLLHGPTEDGEGVQALRARQDRLGYGPVMATVFAANSPMPAPTTRPARMYV